MTESSDKVNYILAELTRRLDEVASRLETGFARMDATYVRQDLFDLTISRSSDSLRALQASAEEANKMVTKRISELEDDKKWLTRLLIGFIIMGVLAAVYGAARLGGAR